MRLDHLGIAVRSLEESLKLYRDNLGLCVEDIRTVPAEKVRVAMMPLAGTRIELLEATANDSPIARFIERRGEGIHHIAIAVSRLEERLQELEAAGVRVLPGKGEYGAGGHRYAFLHPSSCGGVLVELVEISDATGEGAR
jgi:methylmalonyl-CoA/ethylmalonyl-CoA epimerase